MTVSFHYALRYFVIFFPAVTWVLSSEPPNNSALPVAFIEDLLSCEEYIHSTTPTLWLRRALTVNRQQVAVTAEKTCGQRDNNLWAAVKKLRFTASNFGDILKACENRRSVFKHE